MSPSDLLHFVVLAPLASATILLLWQRAPKALVTALGVGSLGVAAALTAIIALNWLPVREPMVEVLWQWIALGDFTPRFAFYLDGLSMTMLGVVTGVGFLIHSYASGYMRDDPNYRQFFAYMNLFVAMMLVLVLADNLLLTYLGWEGVGLCSYLLVGFFNDDPANGLAARKSFIVTRVGDTFMALGLFLIFRDLHTLDLQGIQQAAPKVWGDDHSLPLLASLLLLGGAVGKSAQLPLHTWLPDAMAGPTPVSALIHAATMVTAGVYLIARLNGLYLLPPEALEVVGWIGACTLLLAGTIALVQTDIKRVLAYSTMSQIGYMFMALGAGAWHAAIFHLMTHAFFKALLFLASGSVIMACHHEQDIFRMGALRKKLPLAFASFLVGGSALAALPIVTSGFWSKEAILAGAWSSHHQIWWGMGVACAFLTGLYTFRMIFIVFFGQKEKTHAHDEDNWRMRIPLAVLIVLSLVGGLIVQPLDGVLPHQAHELASHLPEYIAVAAGLSGIALAWLLYRNGAPGAAPAETGLRAFVKSGWGFDALYDRLFVQSLYGLARLNHRDVFDQLIGALVSSVQALHRQALRMQTGQIRRYAIAATFGTVLLLGGAVLTEGQNILIEAATIALVLLLGVVSWS